MRIRKKPAKAHVANGGNPKKVGATVPVPPSPELLKKNVVAKKKVRVKKKKDEQPLIIELEGDE